LEQWKIYHPESYEEYSKYVTLLQDYKNGDKEEVFSDKFDLDNTTAAYDTEAATHLRKNKTSEPCHVQCAWFCEKSSEYLPCVNDCVPRFCDKPTEVAAF
jgi:hypothetical protein